MTKGVVLDSRFRGNDGLGAEDDPRAAVVTPAVLVYAVPGKTAFAIASGAERSDVPQCTVAAVGRVT